jgi:voltage-gated potassium channel
MEQDVQKKVEEKNVKEKLDKERYKLLRQIQNKLELPMIILGFVWLLLLIGEFIWGLYPVFLLIANIIWIIFILDFLLKFFLAPYKISYLRKNILTLVSLVVPALRIFRIARFFRVLRGLRAVRGIRLIKVIASINRGMRSLSGAMQRRAVGYVIMLTIIVIFSGAAGIRAFEDYPESDLKSYWSALWWTAMLITSIGSEYWPRTPEGRTLCLLLSIYGISVFGYLTATLATFFIGQDAESNKAEVAGAKQIKELHNEITNLKHEIQNFMEIIKKPGADDAETDEEDELLDT